ncbi:MAG: radical SAM protein, partial [Candidatus Omnitrophica bacterium]|nr:radical SAM protein [Candidatus Omnitrophota bacterium]
MAPRHENILFYYHHSEEPGHVERIANICKELEKCKSCKVIIVNSGKKQSGLGIEQYATVLNLPSWTTECGSCSEPEPNPDTGLEKVFQDRSKILKRIISGFRPNVAIFQDVPFENNILAKEAELFMELLQEKGCSLYLSLRDIVWQSVDVVHLVKHIRRVNGIFVYSDKDREALINFRDSHEWKEKIFFMEGLENEGTAVQELGAANRVDRRGVAMARIIQMACHMKSLMIHLITQCNLACDMCNWDKKEQFPPFPLEVFKKLVVKAKVVGIQTVHVLGGEVTLLPNIKEILQYIGNNDLRVELTTNGYVNPLQWAELAPMIDSINISLDSYDAGVHDKIRGRAGTFERTMGTIKLLAEYRMHRSVTVTVGPDNYRGLHRMVILLEGQIDFISFRLVDMGDDSGRNFIFREDQLNLFYFKEVPLILRECIKRNIGVSIDPFFKG